MTVYRKIYDTLKVKKRRALSVLENNYTPSKIRDSSPKQCPKCNKDHYKEGSYCSRGCANSRVCNKETKIKISKSGTISLQLRNRWIKKKVKEIINKDFLIVCPQCSKEFIRLFRRNPIKYCSYECRRSSWSKQAIKRVLNSDSKFYTKRKEFTYNNIDVKCDSLLEEASIIYLQDILNIWNIKRYNWILIYRDSKNKKRRTNPDFQAEKDGVTYIIEVKMPIHKKNRHKYNKDIPYKKEALETFCKKNGYKDIWLDFTYDKRLKPIYDKHRKNKMAGKLTQ